LRGSQWPPEGKCDRHGAALVKKPARRESSPPAEHLRSIARHFRRRITCWIRRWLGQWLRRLGLFGGSRSGGAIGSWSGFGGLPGADMGTYLLLEFALPTPTQPPQALKRADSREPTRSVRQVLKFRGSCLLPWLFGSPRPSQPPSHRRWPSGRRPSTLERHLPP
jgi:hypothetical protein